MGRGCIGGESKDETAPVTGHEAGHGLQETEHRAQLFETIQHGHLHYLRTKMHELLTWNILASTACRRCGAVTETLGARGSCFPLAVRALRKSFSPQVRCLQTMDKGCEGRATTSRFSAKRKCPYGCRGQLPRRCRQTHRPNDLG